MTSLRCTRKRAALLAAAVVYLSFLASDSRHGRVNLTIRTNKYGVARPFSATGARTSLEDCTDSQLSVMRHQLPSGDCSKHRTEPWHQTCSLTYATKCPDNVWLQNHYQKLHGNTGGSRGESKKGAASDTFVGVFVGCNKGFDAVDALRLGSGSDFFDKTVWREALASEGGDMSSGVCNQESADQFDLTSQQRRQRKVNATVHCIEPMPPTVKYLRKAARKTGYDKKGLVVQHAAVSREEGVLPFHTNRRAGVENLGIGRCDASHNCTNVTVYSLDAYFDEFIPPGAPVDYLSVDAEGYDFEVLLGGSRRALHRVRYLEFEYNWMGPWSDRGIDDAVSYLEGYGFACYFAGYNNTAWRVSTSKNCWIETYAFHYWSNVACVNRGAGEARELAYELEETFRSTLGRLDAVRDYDRQRQHPHH